MKGHSEYTLGYLWVAYCTNNHFLKPFWCILERINASSHFCVLHSRTYSATKTRGSRCPKKELTNATWMFFCRVRERQRKVRATVAPQTNLQEQRADSGAKREGAMLKIGRYPEVGGTTKKATWLLTTVLPKRFGAPGALGTSLV